MENNEQATSRLDLSLGRSTIGTLYYLTQPKETASVDEFTWRRAADEARRMACVS